MQLAAAQSDATAVQLEKEQCQKEHAEQCQKLQAAIDAAIVEKDQLEVKWQNDFEQLRTHHSGKYNDCGRYCGLNPYVFFLRVHFDRS